MSHRLGIPRYVRAVLTRTCAGLGLALLLAVPAHAERLVEPTTGITIAVTEDGTYTVQSEKPAWTFTGTVTGGVTGIRTGSGKDRAGEFQEIVFDERAGAARHFGIRTWSSRPAVLFTQVLTVKHANPPAFPRFSTIPDLPHRMSFSGKWFGARFDLAGSEGPWVLFDDQSDTAVLSPASNFMVATLGVGPAGEIESRIHSAITTLPENHAHTTLLVLDRGINHAIDTWGRVLTDLQGKVRPACDADATLKYLGYWTDSGAAYYYKFDAAKGYEGTLLGVRDEFARSGAPIGYMQLDSWWYPKGESGDWDPKPDQWVFGISTYEAHKSIFPEGLASFRERLGVPLVTHARWIDEKSPYRAKYKISNNVAVDPQYWIDVAAYLKKSGVATYEQDWLDFKATAAFTLEDQQAFMDNMAQALEANGITMQYCMATPRHVLQASKYSNLTSIRVSEDHFDRDDWPQVVHASRLASAIGVWPWVDIFESGISENVMVATLTAGVVGASDAIGSIDHTNLLRAARADGVLVKPDSPLVPTDSTLMAESTNGTVPIVAYAYTDHDAGRALYVLGFRNGHAKEAVFTPAECGVSGKLFAYDTRNRAGRIVDAASRIVLDLSADWSNLVIAPVGASGMALVGDESKYAPLGRARIPKLRDNGSGIDVEIAFAAGEDRVTLRGYAPELPEVSAGAGRVLDLTFDEASGIFDVTVAPGPSRASRITIHPPAPQKTPRLVLDPGP